MRSNPHIPPHSYSSQHPSIIIPRPVYKYASAMPFSPTLAPGTPTNHNIPVPPPSKPIPRSSGFLRAKLPVEMAGESEMDKRGLAEDVRDEVMRGCRLTVELQAILNSAHGPDLRYLTVNFSAEIVATFSNALRLLHSTANFSPANSPRSGPRSHAGGREPSSKILKCDNNQLPQSSQRLQTKKNLLPRLKTRIPAYSAEPGNDGPPKDGYSWRKYGQKEILGAQYPRSYYRCTHRSSTGCQASKQVQRAEDDPSVFEITYRGCHSCEIEHSQIPGIRLPSPIPPIGSPICDLRCRTPAINGLAATQFNCSSGQASSLWFGIDPSSGCKVENEELGDFGKALVPSPLSYICDFFSDPPHEGTSTSSAMQFNASNRAGEMYVPFSPARNRGGDGKGLNGCGAISEGELGMPDFAGFFGSHESYVSNCIPAAPLMGSMERANSYGHRKASESELTEVVSCRTSAYGSPMPDMDLVFDRETADPFLQFGRNQPF